MTDLSAHPVHAIPPVGDPYVLGRWHRDRVSARGYLLEARVALKALVVRGRPERFLILARPRSGTTLLYRLLDQVPGLECDGEMEADLDGLEEIASRSRGTPRIANRLLKRTRDYALVMADNRVTGDVARAGLEQLSVDQKGLDQSDHRLLSSLIDKFDGGPVGLETLAASINEDSDTIMDVLEPYLLQLGFLDRTPRGRMATRAAYEYLGKTYQRAEPSDQGRLAGL